MGLLRQFLVHQKEMEKRIHAVVVEIQDGKRARTEQVKLVEILPMPEVRCMAKAIEKEETQLGPDVTPRLS